MYENDINLTVEVTDPISSVTNPISPLVFVATMMLPLQVSDVRQKNNNVEPQVEKRFCLPVNEFNQENRWVDFTTETCKIMEVVKIPESQTENYIKLKTKVKNELSSYRKYIKSDPTIAEELINKFTKIVSGINFINSSVELTPSNSIKYKLLLDDNYMLVLSKPFDDIEGLKKDDVVFNLFLNRKCIISDVKNIYELAEISEHYL